MRTSKSKNPTFVTRFAPSPSGRLHKGHAYSALLAYRAAQKAGGRFLLRIEDIDLTRCRPEYIDGIYEDLAWLGLTWELPVRVQSQHFSDFKTAMTQLRAMGLVYPCFCTRKDIQTEIANAERAPHGPDGPIYPRLCHGKSTDEQKGLIASGKARAWRLDLPKALEHIGVAPVWFDEIKGDITATPEELGDVVLARKDTPTSYHLSVVIDDALQGITHVVRGQDLYHATHIHVVLQRLLGLPSPTYYHHGLLLDAKGERFAKRNKSATLQFLRKSGVSAEQLIEGLALKRDA